MSLSSSKDDYPEKALDFANKAKIKSSFDELELSPSTIECVLEKLESEAEKRVSEGFNR